MHRTVPVLTSWIFALTLGSSVPGRAQQERHGRGYKAPPATAEVTVIVEKAFNEKVLPNASVVFRASRDGKIIANLETKTDPEGKASLDLLEVGSHVTVQVIAGGFATYAADFDLTDAGKQVLVKMQRPRAQVSEYENTGDRPSAIQPGVQEHRAPASPPPTSSPTTPLQTPPPAVTPPPAAAAPSNPKTDPQ